MAKTRRRVKKSLESLPAPAESAATPEDAPLEVFVFPNPVPAERRRITIRLAGDFSAVRAQLFDQNGNMVEQNAVLSPAGQDEWNMSIRTDLPGGLYILTILAGDHQVSKKLILL